MDLFATLVINDTRHNDTVLCCYADCCVYLNLMLSVIFLSVVALITQCNNKIYECKKFCETSPVSTVDPYQTFCVISQYLLRLL
jgi:hypothetical protein